MAKKHRDKKGKKAAEAERRKRRKLRLRRQEILSGKMAQMQQALKDFASQRLSLRKQFRKDLDMLPKDYGPLAGPISMLVWLLRDCAVLLDYVDRRVPPGPSFECFVVEQTLEEYPREFFLLPAPEGPFPVALEFGGLGSELWYCKWNDIEIPYAYSTIIHPDDPRLSDPAQAALLDFRLTVLGWLAERNFDLASGPMRRKPALEQFEDLLQRFAKLLTEAKNEEEVQVFLKEHPILLGPAREVLPKQKLGEDFVTDFVVRNVTPNGNEYTLVEIERPDRRLFTMAGTTTADLAHAERQILDWRVWLENNTAYLKNKLPEFGSPQFQIIMGRSEDLTEADRARLRAKNAQTHNQTIMTYDELLLAGLELVESFRRMTHDN